MSCLSIEQLNNGNVVISEVVTFDSSKKQEYLNLFEDRVKEGIIKQGVDFYDEVWTTIIADVEYRIVFLDDILLKKGSKLFGISSVDFNLAFRSFVLYKIKETPRRLISFTGFFKHFLNQEKHCESSISSMKYITLSFIEYLTIPKKSRYFFKKIFKAKPRSPKEGTESANIPDFKDIFLLSDIVNDIIQNKKIIDYKEHLLFILWWKICSILPLRPSEFLVTRFSCIYQDKNKYFLKVLRSKGKTEDAILNVSKIEDYYEENIVVIDQSLFELIKIYQELLVKEFKYEEKEELFPFALIKDIGHNRFSTREVNKNKLIPKDISNAIDRFYKSVVNKEYGFTTIDRYDKKEPDTEYIQNINPRDLRHIAIINLVLMGCSVLDVMVLAGHKKINTAFSYFNHVKQFSRGYALGYMKSIRAEGKMKENDVDLHKNSNSSTMNKIKNEEEFYQILSKVKGTKLKKTPVDGGKCNYSSLENDRSPCLHFEGNHKVCPYFISDNKIQLIDELTEVEIQIDSNIEILKDLIRDMNNISKFNELYHSISSELNKNIRDLAYLNTKILQEEDE